MNHVKSFQLITNLILFNQIPHSPLQQRLYKTLVQTHGATETKLALAQLQQEIQRLQGLYREASKPTELHQEMQQGLLQKLETQIIQLGGAI